MPHEELGRHGMKIQETFGDITIREILSQVPRQVLRKKTLKRTKKRKKKTHLKKVPHAPGVLPCVSSM